MSHAEQLQFVRSVRSAFPDFFAKRRVLEVGSGEIGPSVRQYFEGCDYIGIDVAEGPGVDLVCSGQDLAEPTRSFDVVLSCECFEHDPFWAETFANMIRMLKPGGLCVISCALTGRSEHGTRRADPHASFASANVYPRYYKNLSPADLRASANLDGHFSHFLIHQNIYHKDLYFVGIRRSESSSADAEQFEQLKATVRRIRRDRPMTPLARAVFKHYLKVGFVTLLGEECYHDARYQARQNLKRSADNLLGPARHQQIRQLLKARRKRLAASARPRLVLSDWRANSTESPE